MHELNVKRSQLLPQREEVLDQEQLGIKAPRAGRWRRYSPRERSPRHSPTTPASRRRR